MFDRRLTPSVLAMVATVVASNILVQYPFTPFGLGDLLTWGAFTYPFAFLVTDLTNRQYGPRNARLVVLCGFVVGVTIAVLVAAGALITITHSNSAAKQQRLVVGNFETNEPTAAQIDAYVASGEPLGKAGAYAIQGAAAQHVEHLSGSYSGIMGLPLFETARLLRAAGVLAP